MKSSTARTDGGPAHGPEVAFCHQRDVGDEDIDMLGHASNIAYLQWVQEVALLHSAAVGLDYDAYVKVGGVFIVRRQEIDYLRSALRGQRLELRTWVGTVHAAKCERHTEIADAGTGTVLARALTIWGYVDLGTGRPTRIPDNIRLAFDQPRGRGRRGSTEVPV